MVWGMMSAAGSGPLVGLQSTVSTAQITDNRV